MGITSSKDKSDCTKTKLVIVGGSYSGRAAVYLLDPTFDVTWIERRPILIHKMMVRSMVIEDWIEPALVPNEKLIRRGKLIHGNVRSVDTKTKEVECETVDGVQKVNYDFLIIASGATTKCPIEPRFTEIGGSTRETIYQFFKSIVSTISKHNSILILGGGPVGCEVAGEIKSRYPSKEVYIANRTMTLCSGMHIDQAGSDKIKKGLEKHGIKVFLNTTVNLSQSEHHQGLLEYSAPRNFCDDQIKDVTLAINCTGSTPNTDFVPSEFLTPEKLVNVNEYLQASESIFAIGDCTNIKEPKLFVTSGTKKFMFGLPVGHADIVARNLKALVEGKPLTAYKPVSETAKPQLLIPLGPKDAVALNAPGFIARMKAKDYFYPGHWKFGGAQPPKRPAIA